MTPQQRAADAVLRLGDCGLALLNIETLKNVIAAVIAEDQSVVTEKMFQAFRKDVEAAILEEREACASISKEVWHSEPDPWQHSVKIEQLIRARSQHCSQGDTGLITDLLYWVIEQAAKAGGPDSIAAKMLKLKHDQ